MKNIIVVILLIIYIASPIDLIPDIGPWGLIDDVIACLIAYRKIIKIIDELDNTESPKSRKYIILIVLLSGLFMVLFGIYSIFTAIFG